MELIQPPNQCLLSRGLRRPGREINHSLPSSAEVKNEWRYVAIPLTCLYGAAKGNFTSIFTLHPSVHIGSEAQSTSYSIGKAALLPGSKRPECETDHLLSSTHTYLQGFVFILVEAQIYP